jgi:hypothetical protein
VNDIQDPSEYCRRIETYLCRKNEGHLIRIAGPVFEQVCGWAARGVPLQIAFKGIDRYCDRYYSKPQRRPVRIEFCEADILEMFDDWRRAVGVVPRVNGTGEAPRRPSLSSHLERVLARLTALRGGQRSPAFSQRIDDIVREVDALKSQASHARGNARQQIVRRLEGLDDELARAARDELEPTAIAALRRDAELELGPFASRMPPEALAAAIDTALGRLVRDAIGLPIISYQ